MTGPLLIWRVLKNKLFYLFPIQVLQHPSIRNKDLVPKSQLISFLRHALYPGLTEILAPVGSQDVMSQIREIIPSDNNWVQDVLA